MINVRQLSPMVIKGEVHETEQHVLLLSDVHYDSQFCDRVKFKRALDLAIERNALIMMAGDFFDAMQGRFDPRKSLDELRPEYRTDRYYDVILNDAIEFMRPYAQNLFMVGYGNHETAVLNKIGTDLIERFVDRLSDDNHKIYAGGYGGWVRFLMFDGKRRGGKNYYYHHGCGGSAPVTRGAIATNRQAVYLPDADIVHNGHNHQSYVMHIPRERLSNKGVRYQDIQWHVRTPGYKREAIQRDDGLGYGHERHPGPTPNGCAWMRLYWEDEKPQVSVTSDIY
jgi:hypothetical protein